MVKGSEMRWRWKLGRIVAYILAKSLFGFRVVGRENLLKNSAQILAANHRSHLDPFLVGLASGQEIYFMAKQELFEISKFFKWLISFWNAIPLPRGDRAIEALKKCSVLLKSQKTVVIFPEGTRNKFENGLLPFKPGLGFLAITNQVPIVPVAINGVRDVWNGRLTTFIDKDIYEKGKKQNPTHQSKARCGARLKIKSITVKFGKPVFANGYSKNRDDYEKIAKTVSNNIVMMLEESNEK